MTKSYLGKEEEVGNATIPIETSTFEMRKLKIPANSKKLQMMDV